MKLILLSIATILLSSNALAADFSQLGSMTEYTCVVEIKSSTSIGYYTIYQTCDVNDTKVIDTVENSTTSAAKLQIEVIKAMRPKGFQLVSHSSDNSAEGGKIASINMVFQKL